MFTLGWVKTLEMPFSWFPASFAKLDLNLGWVLIDLRPPPYPNILYTLRKLYWAYLVHISEGCVESLQGVM